MFLCKFIVSCNFPKDAFQMLQINRLFLHILFYNRRKLRVPSAKEKTQLIAVIL
jgi:hypothetical protein